MAELVRNPHDAWVPLLDYGSTAQQTRDWILEMKMAASINCSDPLVVSVLHAALQLSPLNFKVPTPVLATVGTHVSAEMKTEMDKVEIQLYAKKKQNLEMANARAFAIILAAVKKGSVSEIMLENNKDWVENKDGSSKVQGYLNSARAVKAIVNTHITSRHGTDQNSDRATEKRRMEAQAQFEKLELNNETTLPLFHQKFARMAKNMNDEGCQLLG